MTEPIQKRRWAGLAEKRPCWRLTLRGWLLLLLLAAGLAWLGLHSIYPFLATTSRVDRGILVLEGWVPDYEIPAVREEFARSRCDILYITGGPLLNGEPLAEYKNYANLTASVLAVSGFSPQELVAVPSTEAMNDRTYASARALRAWLIAHHRPVSAINLITRGCHARRSRRLFFLAFQREIPVGVISLKDGRYDEARWWRTSEGAKDVIEECIGYAYVRLFFRGP